MTIGSGVNLLVLVCCCSLQLVCNASSSSTRQVEVYGFAVASTPTYLGYDWSVLTTSAWRTDTELVNLARQHGAKVEVNAGNVTDILGNVNKQIAWVRNKVAEVLRTGAGGINFDLEIPMQAASKAARGYTRLVALTAAHLRKTVPGATVSVDTPWSPYDVDGRNYDWQGLAAAADLLFLMAYDTRSQVLGRCIASANSPIDAVRRGVRQWLELGIPANKLVLGLPWYGYDYICLGPDLNSRPVTDIVDVCHIQAVPFQGVSCSDAAGVQRCYSEIMAMIHPQRAVNTTSVRREPTQASPYFNYKAPDGSVHQVWFDDPESLALKYEVAVEHDLLGIGFWNLDCLDYSSSDSLVQQQTRAMWAAVEAAVSVFKAKHRIADDLLAVGNLL